MSARPPVLNAPGNGQPQCVLIKHPSRTRLGRVELLIDLQDLPTYRAHKWAVCNDKRTGVVLQCRSAEFKHTPLHRMIVGAKPREYVAFRTQDRLDFRRSNLSLMSKAERYKRLNALAVAKSPPSSRFRFFVKAARPAGLSRKVAKQIYNGRVILTPQFVARFKGRIKRYSISKYGVQQAALLAMTCLVGFMREEGVEPPFQFLDMLEQAKRAASAKGGFEEIYGGNAEYENTKVVAREVAHWAQPYEGAA